MMLSEYRQLIDSLPVRNHSFDIKASNWIVGQHRDKIADIFMGNTTITLTRSDLFNSTYDIETFVFKTLMWGYPTRGRGNNIENLLTNENFQSLCKILYFYRDKQMTISQLESAIQSIFGLGL